MVTIDTKLTIREVFMNLHIKDFPEDLHYEAKVFSAMNKISLKELVIMALKDYLKKHKK